MSIFDDNNAGKMRRILNQNRSIVITGREFNLKHGFFTAFFLTLILLTCGISICSAGVNDGSREKYQNRLINHGVTPDRTAIIEDRIARSGGTDRTSIGKLERFADRTIFWRGRVIKFKRYPGHFWLLIKPSAGRNFWVYAKNNIRNLDFDRTGYTIGVKGRMILKNNRLYYVQAKSIVLIAPRKDISFISFREKYRLPESFTMNTASGPVTIRSKYYPFILHRIYCHNPHYKWEEIKKIGKSVIYYSRNYGIDPLLLTALLNIESAFDVDAVSRSGAIGLGQLMPGTAASLGVDPHNTVQNVGGAARYLYYQLRRWRGYRDRESRALASYNAGPGAVSRYGGIPPYSETRNYVFFITFLRKEYIKQFNNQ